MNSLPRRVVRWIVVIVGLGCNGSGSDAVPTGDTAAPTVSDTSQPPASRNDAIVALTGVAASGASPYAQECVGCHPQPGDSGNYPPLETVVPDRTELQLVAAVVDGFPSALGPMRAYGDDFTDQQVADLVAYMIQTYGG